MGKKIVSVSTVKNESDIIESFCRHTLSFCDEMYICDDNSTDQTPEILEKLVEEGLMITVLQSAKHVIKINGIIINDLIKIAIKNSQPDFILALDADEFLMPFPGRNVNVREVLENIPDTAYNTFAAYWVQFMPTSFKRKNNVFLPSYFTKYINDFTMNPTEFKVMFHSSCITERNTTVNTGNHNLFYLNENNHYEIVEKKVVPELMLAHCTLRSVPQLIMKSIIFSMHTICTPESQKGNIITNERYWTVYELLRKKGYITEGDLRAILAMTYRSDRNNIKENVNFANYYWNLHYELKYTDYSKVDENYLAFILTNYESVITNLVEKLDALQNPPAQ
ncbi:MAG: glycosyltransferase family 2 protein [Clostridiales bacterium]|jgi:glycosyltransferase involved in cell wall biosynthesis|nr:glycosyltransferase family 2 protein [Clostridiales bacterium]